MKRRFDLTFQSVEETVPGEKWATQFNQYWPKYRKWFLSQGDAARPTYGQCLKQLREYMPELVPTYKKLTELAGGSDTAARFLSMYCPPPYLSGCTQAVWTGDQPVLVRNYDYDPALLEGLVLSSCWNGQKVIAMSDACWGVLDGMNESGLAVSLAFGGRVEVGEGFGIPIILRYILEFCEDTESAVAVLKRVPTHMSYNVTIIDRHQRFVTVYVTPDRLPVVRQVPVATNHQGNIEWARHAWVTATLERESAVQSVLSNIEATVDDLVNCFMRPPVYNANFEYGFGTLYSSIYNPLTQSIRYLWPNQWWDFSFQQFREQSTTISFENSAATKHSPS